ncbi:MAG TPA: hypothetical protein VNS12_06080 [Pelagibacterium sp.]|uniref:hypothetical protein n=1 Tax=Pelagibacterium sp. TaxID=1967288 RepID=UPI002B76C849|nr:hypothetical protein [Pelagibacterium sp.]HWJ87618.1 hypothetical protein [Pelagibacterium sp.]
MAEDERRAEGDDAALSAWEQKEGNTPDTPPHPKLARLTEAFEAHTDVCALQGVLDAAMNDAAAPVPVTVEVQPGLLALLMHTEGIDAARAGRAPDSPEHVLARRVSNQLEHLLHGFAIDPTSHPHFAAIWNGLCADAGAPELVVPNSDRAAKDMPPAERGPF